MVISFPTRKSAEIAAIQGTECNGKTLSLSWFTGNTNKVAVNPGPQNVQRRVTRSLSQSLMDKELEDELLVSDFSSGYLFLCFNPTRILFICLIRFE